VFFFLFFSLFRKDSSAKNFVLLESKRGQSVQVKEKSRENKCEGLKMWKLESVAYITYHTLESESFFSSTSPFSPSYFCNSNKG
jgi:hypothetical protein